MTPTIRLATADDAVTLSALAERTFRETFGADNRPEDLAMFLAATFTPEHQARELSDPAMQTLVVEEHGVLIGYAQLRSGYTPSCVSTDSPIELQRFYVASAWHGRGLAQQLMDRVLETARARGAKSLWLGVWERNPRAIAFYSKSGYVDVGSHVFVLGADRQTDRILVRAL